MNLGYCDLRRQAVPAKKGGPAGCSAVRTGHRETRLKHELHPDMQPVTKALSAVRKCADTMEAQAKRLLESLPDLPMDGSLRAKALALGATLKDTANRALFEVALLQGELDAREADVAAAIRRLAAVDAAMMEVVAAAADVVEQLEKAAERDEAHEAAFVTVIEAVGVMLQALDEARAATSALER